jgi:integrase
VRRNLIARNPADGAELPAAPRRRRLPIDVAGLQALLASTAAQAGRHEGKRLGHAYAQWAALWTFLANTGLRLGEALGLRWADVDLEVGWFAVTGDLERGTAGAASFGETKTEAGDRHVPLTKPALAALRALRDRQDALRRLLGADYAGLDLVFASARGTPLGERNALRAFKAAVARAQLPPGLSPHDLRRMTASLLVTIGVDLATAAAILGHKNASVLLDVYASALRGSKAAALRKLEGALYGPVTAPNRGAARNPDGP